MHTLCVYTIHYLFNIYIYTPEKHLYIYDRELSVDKENCAKEKDKKTQMKLKRNVFAYTHQGYQTSVERATEMDSNRVSERNETVSKERKSET